MYEAKADDAANTAELSSSLAALEARLEQKRLAALRKVDDAAITAELSSSLVELEARLEQKRLDALRSSLKDDLSELNPAQPSNPTASHRTSEDERFQAAYAEVLQSSGRPFSFAQLCLVGEGRAGKTALANSLCGRAFKQTDSTIGVEFQQMQVTQVDLQVAETGSCSVLQRSAGRTETFAEDQLAWAIVQQLEGRQGSNSGSVADSIRIPEPQNSFDFADSQPMPSSFSGPHALTSPPPPAAASLSAQSQQVRDISSPSTLSASIASVQGAPSLQSQSSSNRRRDSSLGPPVIRTDKQLVLQRSREEEPLRINLLDFGGQKAFYSLHSLYITRNGVYLLVFNMQWLAGPTAAEVVGRDGSTKRASCLSYLAFWLNSIYLHAEAPDQSVAPILLVGTHGDSIRSPA